MDLEALATEIGRAVAARAAADEVPGVAVGLLHGDERHRFSWGETNRDHPLPVTATTLFQVASISKVFAATAAVALARKKVVDLSEPIRSYVPELNLSDPDCSARLTLEDLLSHRAGWPGDFDADTGRGDDALAKLAPLWSAAPQWAPLGTQFSYSNLGFCLAGYAMSRAAGRSFEEVVRSEVIEPLGLERTDYFLENLAFERWAAGHRRRDGEIRVAGWDRPRARGPNGGILSCVDDLLSFAAFHLAGGRADNGEQVLPEEAVEDMRRPRITDTTETSVGLSWVLQHFGGVTAVGHYGSTAGFNSGLVTFPDHKLAVAVLTNAGHGRSTVEAAVGEVLRVALGIEFEPLATRAFDSAEVAEVAGRYQSVGAALLVRPGGPAGLELCILAPEAAGDAGAVRRRSGLLAVATDSFTTEASGNPGPSGASKFDGVSGRLGTVARDGDGRVIGLRIGRRLFRRTADL